MRPVALYHRRLAAGFVALAAAFAPLACSSDGSTEPRYEAIDLPHESGAMARVASLSYGYGEFWAAGSTISADGERQPALWRSADARTWLAVTTEPVSFYGERAELYSVAAGPAGVVAVGAASGGAHGNPRPATWVLDGDVLREVTAPFELYGGPRAISMRAVAAGPTGYVIIGSRRAANERTGAVAWVSDDGREFTLVDDDPELSSEPDELTRGAAVGTSADGFVATGDVFQQGRGTTDTAGVIWASPDGRTWTRIAEGEAGLGVGGSVSVTAVAGTVAAGVAAEDGDAEVVVWRRADDGAWEPDVVPDWDETPVVTGLAAADGAAVVAGLDGGEPVLALGSGDDWQVVAGPPAAPSGQNVVATIAVAADVMLLAVTDDSASGLWRAEW